MSFSLGISGHHNDQETAAKIDSIVRTGGESIVKALREAGIDEAASSLMANFSGPTGSVNLLLPVEPTKV